MSRHLALMVRVSLAMLAAVGIVGGLIAVASPAHVASAVTMALAVSALSLVVALAIAVLAPVRATQPPARPRAQIDDSALVAQSDPDAAGHSRSRAPGLAALAA